MFDDGVVAAVEAVGDAKQGAEAADDLAIGLAQIAEAVVVIFGDCFLMIAGNQADDLDLFLAKTEELTIDDQILGVTVVVAMADVMAESGTPETRSASTGKRRASRRPAFSRAW